MGPGVREGRESIFLLFYPVIESTGDPSPREGQGFGWFNRRELLALDHAPGNTRALKELRGYLFWKS